MSDRATDDRVDAEVGRALATLAAGRERVYYDADADAPVRARYYAAIDESESPEQLFHSLGVLLEHTHAPRLPYKPAERVYPWVDLHPDGRLLQHLLRQGLRPRAVHPRRRRDRAPARGAPAGARAARVHARSARVRGRLRRARARAAVQLRARRAAVVVRQARADARRPAPPVRLRAALQQLPRQHAVLRLPRLRGAADVATAGAARLRASSRWPARGRWRGRRCTSCCATRARSVTRRASCSASACACCCDWHRANPVEEYERHRNAAIAEAQGNRNPLIDHPEWAGADRLRGELRRLTRLRPS